jgi:hypothetical protein
MKAKNVEQKIGKGRHVKEPEHPAGLDVIFMEESHYGVKITPVSNMDITA